MSYATTLAQRPTRWPMVALTLAMTACSSSAPELGLQRCEPTMLEARTGGALRIEGTGFLPRSTVDFDGPSVTAVDAAFLAELVSPSTTTELLGVTRLDSENLSGRVPPALAAGIYGVRVKDPRGRTALLAQCLQLLP